MKNTTLILLFIGHIVLSQNNNRMIIIEGQILAPDSIPIENAYLISYQTLRAFATDENGKFSILSGANDSLKIEHVSFKPIVVYAKSLTNHRPILLEYKENMIGEVPIVSGARSIENMNSNMSIMIEQVQKELYTNCQPDSYINPYNPNPKGQNSYIGVDFVKLYQLIQYKRKQKKK